MLLIIEKDTLTLNISGKEFHVIIPMWRTQCFVFDLFTLKILIWLLVLVFWQWIWLLISKLNFISSSIFECYTWKTSFETWRLYWSESLSILLHLEYALVCSLYARLFIACMVFFWRTKIFLGGIVLICSMPSLYTIWQVWMNK